MKRIQPKPCAHVEDEAGPFPAVAGFRGRVQALRLGGSVGQVLLVPVPAWLDVLQDCERPRRVRRVLLVVLHLVTGPHRGRLGRTQILWARWNKTMSKRRNINTILFYGYLGPNKQTDKQTLMHAYHAGHCEGETA